MSIKNNTTILQSLLEQVNNLPEGNGIDTSDATAVAEDIFLNKTAYVNNEKITGNFTIDEELDSQTQLILQMLDMIEDKAGVSKATPCTIIVDSTLNEMATFTATYVTIDDQYNNKCATTVFHLQEPTELIVSTDSLFTISDGGSGTALTTSISVKGDFEVISNNHLDLKLYIPKNSLGGTIVLYSEDCCFIPGTQILTSLEGDTVSIENLSEGDTIVSYNITTDTIYLAKVKKLIINKNTTDIAEVYFENNSSLIMNAYHPIYTINGFHSLTKYNEYDELKIGDVVKTSSGWTTITNIVRYFSEPIITYNLDVIDFDEEKDNEVNDTFFANGIAVHNASVCK